MAMHSARHQLKDTKRMVRLLLENRAEGGGNDNALRDASVGGFERWGCCYSKRVQISTFRIQFT